MNPLPDRSDLCRDGYVLASKNTEDEPRQRWKAVIILMRRFEQLRRAITSLRRDNAELGHMPADRIR